MNIEVGFRMTGGRPLEGPTVGIPQPTRSKVPLAAVIATPPRAVPLVESAAEWTRASPRQLR